MTLTLQDFIGIASLVITTVVTVGGIAWRITRNTAARLESSVETIRTNDMHHLGEKIDRLDTNITSALKLIIEHLIWHAEHKD